ncbi:MAG: DUF47 family protein [Thermoplasmatales archaeon]
MQKSSIFKRLTSIGEKKLLSSLTSFSDLGIDVSNFLIKMMSEDMDQMDALNESVKMKEKEGDELSENVTVLITRGAINPSLIDNLLSLVNKMDDVIDRAYYLSRELKRMNLGYIRENSNLRPALTAPYQMFIHMLNAGKDALVALKGMLLESDMGKINEYKKKIEIIEESVDDMKDCVLDDAYKNADRMNYIIFNHVTSMVHKIDDMVDDCEDAADLILSVYESLTG